MRDLEDEARIKAYMAEKMRHIKMYNECMNLADGLDVEKFAELVRADERQKIEEQFERRIHRQKNNYGKTMQKLIADEREACAKVCDARANEDGFEGGYADQCAIEIRARGEISQERVDETAKERHVSYVCPNCNWSLDKQVRTHRPEDVKKIEREWVGLSTGEAREFYESDLSREELIHKIDEFLEEKNGGN